MIEQPREQLLQIYPSELHRLAKVSVQFALEDCELTAKFEVQGIEINVDPSLSTKESVWGLWEHDVVELFVQSRKSDTRYYEFQVSPLNQFFELEIFEPRKKFNRDFESHFGHMAEVVATDLWRAEIRVPLDKLGWSGSIDELRVGVFAILGRQGNAESPSARYHFARNWPVQAQPDFHLPTHFTSVF